MTSVSWSIKNGDLDEVKKLVSGANVNVDVDGRKPIHFAADYGQVAVVEYLVSVGADVNSTDQHGITPLLAAIWENHAAVVQLLVANGARFDGKAPDGSNYVDCAESAEIKRMLGVQNCC